MRTNGRRTGVVRFLWRVLGFLVLALVLAELVLRFVLPASSMPAWYQDRTWRIFRFDPALAGQTGMSTYGRYCIKNGLWHINNAGWNSAFDYSKRTDSSRLRVAILGDSSIEGMATDYREHIDVYLFGDLHRQADVYSFGMSGWYLAQYIPLATYVRDNYRPDVYFVCVGTGDVAQSLRDRGSSTPNGYQIEPKGGSFVFVPPQEIYMKSRKRELASKSALVRYLLYNAQVTLPGERVVGQSDAAPPGAEGLVASSAAAADPQLRAAADFMVARLSSDHPDAKIVFVGDTSDRSVYDGTPEPEPVDSPLLVRNAVRNHPNCSFLDLGPWFARDWTLHHERFQAPDGGHWNSHANQVVASAMEQYLLDAHLASP
jgi:hypothetical protein